MAINSVLLSLLKIYYLHALAMTLIKPTKKNNNSIFQFSNDGRKLSDSA
jgi:hypothetical protein